MPESPQLVQVIAEVSQEDLLKFKSIFPGKGAWTTFVRLALRNIIQLNESPFEELVSEAVSNIDATELTNHNEVS